MPRFAANLTMLYPEHAFLDRFAAAAADGFKAVECLFPYAHDASMLADLLRKHDLQCVLFNAPCGDWDAGERGLACLAGRQTEFRASIATALSYAQVLGCARIHVMAGLLPAGHTAAQHRSIYIDNLRYAALQAAAVGVAVMIEPINTHDMPGYFLNMQEQAHALLDDLAQPNVQVQMDLYHCQRMQGDVTQKLRQYLPTGRVGHMQVAGAPLRHEPDTGELNIQRIFDVIDELAWDGWIGCEYRPALGAATGGTTAGLGWVKSYL